MDRNRERNRNSISPDSTARNRNNFKSIDRNIIKKIGFSGVVYKTLNGSRSNPWDGVISYRYRT